MQVNADLFTKFGGQPLEFADLDLAVGMAKLLAALGKEEIGTRVVYLPGENSVLKPAEDMVYDDAPWLSSSLAGKLRLR